VLAKVHPEPDIGLRVMCDKRMHFVVARHVRLLLAHNSQNPFATDLEHLVALPGTLLPAIGGPCKFAKVDFRIEVCREIPAVRFGVDVDDIDGRHVVDEFIHCKASKGIHVELWESLNQFSETS